MTHFFINNGISAEAGQPLPKPLIRPRFYVAASLLIVVIAVILTALRWNSIGAALNFEIISPKAQNGIAEQISSTSEANKPAITFIRHTSNYVKPNSKISTISISILFFIFPLSSLFPLMPLFHSNFHLISRYSTAVAPNYKATLIPKQIEYTPCLSHAYRMW